MKSSITIYPTAADSNMFNTEAKIVDWPMNTGMTLEEVQAEAKELYNAGAYRVDWVHVNGYKVEVGGFTADNFQGAQYVGGC